MPQVSSTFLKVSSQPEGERSRITMSEYRAERSCFVSLSTTGSRPTSSRMRPATAMASRSFSSMPSSPGTQRRTSVR